MKKYIDKNDYNCFDDSIIIAAFRRRAHSDGTITYDEALEICKRNSDRFGLAMMLMFIEDDDLLPVTKSIVNMFAEHYSVQCGNAIYSLKSALEKDDMLDNYDGSDRLHNVAKCIMHREYQEINRVIDRGISDIFDSNDMVRVFRHRIIACVWNYYA